MDKEGHIFEVVKKDPQEMVIVARVMSEEETIVTTLTRRTIGGRQLQNKMIQSRE